MTDFKLSQLPAVTALTASSLLYAAVPIPGGFASKKITWADVVTQMGDEISLAGINAQLADHEGRISAIEGWQPGIDAALVSFNGRITSIEGWQVGTDATLLAHDGRLTALEGSSTDGRGNGASDRIAYWLDANTITSNATLRFAGGTLYSDGGVFLQVDGATTGLNDALVISGRAGGSNGYGITLLPDVLNNSRTIKLPNASGTVALGTGTATHLPMWSAVNTLTDSNAGWLGGSMWALPTGVDVGWADTSLVLGGGAGSAAFASLGTTIVGSYRGTVLTSGPYNTIIGGQTAPANYPLTTGGLNTWVGFGAGGVATGVSGSIGGSTAIGYSSVARDNGVSVGVSASAMGGSVAIGYRPNVATATSSTNSIAIGYEAGAGANTVSIGYKAGSHNVGSTVAANAVIIGSGAGTNETSTTATGAGTVIIGYQAARTLTTGASNTIIGSQACLTTLTTGGSNVAIGHAVAAKLAAAASGVAIGQGAQLTTRSVVIGAGAKVGAGSGSWGSVVIGYIAGNATGGTELTIVGSEAALNLTGGRNVVIGRLAASVATTSQYCTIIGTAANVGSGTDTYATAIGDSATAYTSGVAIGAGGPTAHPYAVAVGQSAQAGPYCVALGWNGSATETGGLGSVSICGDATAGQIVIGGDAASRAFTTLILGRGAQSGTPGNFLFRITDVAGVSNVAGPDLTIRSGNSTGNAAGGKIIFRAAYAGGAGSSLNTDNELLTIDPAMQQTISWQATRIAGLVTVDAETFSASDTITKSRTKFTGSTAAQTLTLPSVAADCFVRNAASVSVSVAAPGGSTIEGGATFTLNPGESVSLARVGIDWTVF